MSWEQEDAAQGSRFQDSVVWAPLGLPEEAKSTQGSARGLRTGLLPPSAPDPHPLEGGAAVTNALVAGCSPLIASCSLPLAFV